MRPYRHTDAPPQADLSPITWAWIGQLVAVGVALGLVVLAGVGLLALGGAGVKWLGLRLWWAVGG